MARPPRLQGAQAGTLACLFAVACSYNFGPDQPWPESGAPVDVRGLQHVAIPLLRQCWSRLLDYPFRFLEGADGATWLVFRDSWQSSEYHLVRLGEPALEERIPGGDVITSVGRRALFFLDSTAREASFHFPGRPGTTRIPLGGAPKDGCCSTGVTENDEVLWWRSPRSIEIARTDGTYRHSFPITPNDPAGVRVFDDVVVQVTGGHLRFHSTREERFVDGPPFGEPPGVAFYRPDLQSIIGCGSEGLLRSPIDGGPSTVLDPACNFIGISLLDACTPSLDDEPDCDTDVCWTDSPWLEAGRRVSYWRHEAGAGSPLRVASASMESGAPIITGFGDTTDFLVDLAGVHAASVALGIGSQSLSRFSGPLSIDDRRVAHHGRALHFSRDGSRVRFIERAATLNGTGQLVSGPIEGPYDPIAHNVLRYDELDDGRLIAAVNLVYLGVHNRVVLLDEARHVVQPLVEGGRDYRLLPGGKQAMVRLVRPGQNEYDVPMDWVRVPLPPPLP